MSRCSRRVMGWIANLTLRQGGGEGIWLGVDIAQGASPFRGMRHHESKHRMRRNSRWSRSRVLRNPIHDERCWRVCGRQRSGERVRLRLVNRAFERYVRYRRRRNEKNESRTVFENLEATFSELFTHTRFISRKVGFFENVPSCLGVSRLSRSGATTCWLPIGSSVRMKRLGTPQTCF